jgi:hypothetical protein
MVMHLSKSSTEDNASDDETRANNKTITRKTR